MKDVEPLDAISESVLRQALRLDADELAPRLDAAAIAAAAERRTTLDQVLRLTRGLALVGVSIGIEAVVALAAFSWLSEIDGASLAGSAIAAFAAVAERLLPVLSLATDPSAATATLAAVVFATIYERVSGRESARVQAS